MKKKISFITALVLTVFVFASFISFQDAQKTEKHQMKV